MTDKQSTVSKLRDFLFETVKKIEWIKVDPTAERVAKALTDAGFVNIIVSQWEEEDFHDGPNRKYTVNPLRDLIAEWRFKGVRDFVLHQLHSRPTLFLGVFDSLPDDFGYLLRTAEGPIVDVECLMCDIDNQDIHQDNDYPDLLHFHQILWGLMTLIDLNNAAMRADSDSDSDSN